MTSARSRIAVCKTTSMSADGGTDGTTATGRVEFPPTLTAMPARLVP